MSNAERQRRFQASHPGYDRRRKARARAAAGRGAEQIRAATAGPAAPAEAAPALPMLPAPAENPLLLAINALATSLAPSAAPTHAPSAAPEPAALADGRPTPRQ